MAQSLTAKAGIVTTDFGRGVQEIREKLKQLNTSLEENKQELKTAAKEANNLRKAQQELASQMENGGTDEQKRQMKQLSDQLAQVNARIGTLRASESELRGAVRNANRELDEQTSEASEQSKKIQQLSEKLIQAKNKENELKNELREATQRFNEQNVAAGNITNSLGGLNNVIRAVIASAAVRTLTSWLFGSNAEMEQYLTSFTVMLGDAEKAKKLMEDLTNFAATTPLEMNDVIKASEMLMNYGVSADDVIKKMTQLGDLSSGNAAKLDRVTLAYGQMLAKGKVTNEELRQMLEAGVPLLQALADTMGVTTGEVQDLASKSKIGIDQLDSAIASLTSDGGKFAGMMDKQSQTFQGMLSNAHDTIEQIGRDVGAQAFTEVKQALSEVIEKVQEFADDGTLKRWTTEAAELVTGVTEAFIGFTGIILDNKEAVLAAITAYMTFRSAIAIGNTISATVAAIRTFTGATQAAEKAQIALNAAGAANPFVMIASLAAGAIAAIVSFVATSESATEAAKALRDEANNLIQTAGESGKAADEVEKLTDEFKAIKNAADESNEAKERLEEIQQTLVDSYGLEADEIDLVNGKYREQLELLEGLSEKKREQSTTEAKAAYLSAQKAQNSEYTFDLASSDTNDSVNVQDMIFEEAEKNDIFLWQDFWNGNKFTFGQGISYRKRADFIKKIIDRIDEEFGNEIDADLYNALVSEYTELDKSAADYDNLEKTYNDLISGEKTLPAGSSVADEEQRKGKKYNSEYAKAHPAFEPDEEKFDEESSNLAYEHDMGNITDEEYYNRLEELGEKYLEKGSEKWKKNNVTVHKGRSSQSTKTAALPEAYTKGKKELKYKYDMGDISEDEYYDKLYELMRSNGISENSDEWRSIDVEKKKSGEKSTAKKTKSGVAEIESAMKSLSDAFSEQKKNAELSVSSVEKLIDLGFEEALSIDETTGKITLKGEKIDELLDKQIAAAQKEIAADGKTTAGAKAKAAMLDTLADKYDDIKNGVFGVIAAETNFTGINKSFKEASDERIKQIDKELEAKKKASNDAIAAIDAEIQARKRAKEDDDIQSEIDAVNAQLKYAQLDEFSRAQLERQLQSLYNQQADTAWERSAEDRKTAINSDLSAEEEAAEKQKEALNSATDTVTDALNDVANGISLTAEQIENAAAALAAVFGGLSEGSASAPNITNNITTNGGTTTNNNTFKIGTESYTSDQLIQIIFSALGNPTI